MIPRKEANKPMEGYPDVWHRTSLVFVENHLNQFCVQKRSMSKGYCPGWYDLGFGGAMGPEDFFSGKDPDILIAQRELNEELGIFVEELEVLNTHQYQNAEKTVKLFCSIFHVRSNAEFKFNKQEIDSIEFLSKEQILEKIESKADITPHSKECFVK